MRLCGSAGKEAEKELAPAEDQSWGRAHWATGAWALARWEGQSKSQGLKAQGPRDKVRLLLRQLASGAPGFEFWSQAGLGDLLGQATPPLASVTMSVEWG